MILDQGACAAIARSLLEFADNWLQLTRLDLIVWTTNETAVRLYQTFGFAIEAHCRPTPLEAESTSMPIRWAG